MRKRIMFQKGGCSLLALLLALSSLMALPVLAAEGEDDGGESVSETVSESDTTTDNDAGSGSNDQSDAGSSDSVGGESDTKAESDAQVETPKDEPKGEETKSEIKDEEPKGEETQDVTKDEETKDDAQGEETKDEETQGEVKGEETKDEETQDETPQDDNDDNEEDNAENEDNLNGEEDLDEEEVLEDELLEEELDEMALFADRFFMDGPVSGDGDTIYLLFTGTEQHKFQFNDVPDYQGFFLNQWNGVELKYGEQSVNDPGVFVDVVETSPETVVAVTLSADYLRSCGICLSSLGTLTVDGARYSLSEMGFHNSPLDGVAKLNWSLFAKNSGKDSVSEWAAARTEDGYYFYAVTTDSVELSLDYPDATINDGAKNKIQVFSYSASVKNGYSGDIPGSSLNMAKLGSTTYYELYIPNAFFPAKTFTVSCGKSVKNVDIPGIDGKPYSNTPKERPPYEGIVIDGQFDDWESVPTRTEFMNPAQNGNPETLVESAIVWDGDYLYVYFKVYAGQPNALGYTGTHGNGKYSIVTDLGRSVYVQPMFNGNSVSVYGVDGATIAIDNYEYEPGVHCTEMAIPTSELPRYDKSISFRFHLGGVLFENVTNMNPVEQPAIGPFNPVLDGDYSEWVDYPHELIEYTTSGSQGKVVDGELALGTQKGFLYGHCFTEYPAHLNALDQGVGITIRLNEISQDEYLTHPRFIQVGPDGVINWSPDLTNATGTNKYLVVDTCVWHDNLRTLDDLNALLAESQKENHNFKMYIYGYAYITVDLERGVVESEFKYDISELARKADIDPNSITKISANYIRIGDEWVSTAGTPTGSLLGLALCFGTVGGVYAVDRKKKKKK